MITRFKSLRPYLEIFFCSTALLLSSCYTVPETGRKGLNLYSDSALRKQANLLFTELKEEQKPINDPQISKRVRDITERIVRAAGPSANIPPPAEWEVIVFDDPAINAFALPGGKIGIYTGIIDITNSDDELATVIGHEIAHIAGHHGRERVSQGLLIGIGGIILGASTTEMDDEKRQLLLAAYGIGSAAGALAYSREHESEADQIGLLYMARAGYDPRKAIDFWEAMTAQSKGSNPPEFLSTHPSHGTRIQQLKEWMPEALKEYKAQ